MKQIEEGAVQPPEDALDGQAPEVQIVALKALLQSADERARLFEDLYHSERERRVELERQVEAVDARIERVRNWFEQLIGA